MNNEYYALIKKVCGELKFEPELIASIVNHESSWNAEAMKYEPTYSYLWQPATYAKVQHITEETETVLQRISYGLSQTMGANARWCGFEYALPRLLDPELSIRYGVLLYQRRCLQYPELKDQISAYNAGHPLKQKDDGYINQAYVDAVFSYYADLKKQGI